MFKIGKLHHLERMVFEWCADSREPVITRRICDLSDDHIVNILIYASDPSVTHIKGFILEMLRDELAGRCNGMYPHVAEYK